MTPPRIIPIITLAALIFATALPAPAVKRQVMVTGKTMGTFYTVKFITSKKQPKSVWKKRMDTTLRDVNKKLSMYDPQSELSRFNRLAPDQEIPVSQEFYTLLTQSRTLHRITNGAWDGTLKPLVDLWGFGTTQRGEELPTQADIRMALGRTGFHRIRVLPGRRAAKTHAVTLDLGSVAKGYGVDALLRLVLSWDIPDVLVEIGGELSARGKNRHGTPWVVGISRPVKSLAGQGLYAAVSLSGNAIATSGNYRNFFEKDGVTYTHIIDPRTGFPVARSIVSASVIARDCAFADGLATALMVLPLDQGLALINGLDQTECLIIEEREGKLVRHPSTGFDKFLVTSP